MACSCNWLIFISLVTVPQGQLVVISSFIIDSVFGQLIRINQGSVVF